MAGAKRRLAAILAADVAGYSRLMGADEHATMEMLNDCRAVFREQIAGHDGRVVDTAGDSVLAIFASVVEAVGCAVEVQSELGKRNAELSPDRRMDFRIGVNLGDVIERDDGTIYGDGVNIAARLESLCDPGGVIVSDDALRQVRNKLAVGFEDIGEHEVKNIAEPVRCYRLLADGVAVGASRPGRAGARSRNMAVAGIAALVAIGGAGAWWAVDRSDGPAAIAPVPGSGDVAERLSIAVLPFENMSGDPEQAYFSDGIAADIITDLSRFDGLFVIARNSTFRYRDRQSDVAEIATDLGARYVLAGSVRRAGEEVRISANLVDASTTEQIWAARYDRDLTDVFAVQDDVTDQIVTALEVALVEPLAGGVSRAGTNDIEAYDLFLRGRAQQQLVTDTSNRQARVLYEQAITLDPDYSDAHAELAYVLYRDWFYQWSDDPTRLEEAVTSARRAVALRDDSALAHARLAWGLAWHEGLDTALVEAERAVALDRNFAEGFQVLAAIQTFLGDYGEAVRTAEIAQLLDPFSFLAAITRGASMFGAEQYDQAITALNETIELNPNLAAARIYLAASYGLVGRDAEAREQAAELTRLVPGGLSSLRPFPTRDPDFSRRLRDGLSKAGLAPPEDAS